MKEFENIVITGYAIVLSIIALFVIFRYWYYRKTKPSRVPIGREKLPYRYFRYLSIVALPLFLTGLVCYIFTFQKGNLFAPYWTKLALIGLFALLLITETGYNLHLQPKKTNRIFNLVFWNSLFGTGDDFS